MSSHFTDAPRLTRSTRSALRGLSGPAATRSRTNRVRVLEDAPESQESSPPIQARKPETAPPAMSAAQRFLSVFEERPKRSEHVTAIGPTTVKARFESVDWDGTGPGIDEAEAQQTAIERAENKTVRNFFKNIKW